MCSHSIVENPRNWPFGDNILKVGNEINFLPHIAEEIINEALPNEGCAVEPIGGENSDRKMHDLALFVGIQSVVKGGAVVPLQVVKKLAQLILYYVEVPAVWPVVP